MQFSLKILLLLVACIAASITLFIRAPGWTILILGFVPIAMTFYLICFRGKPRMLFARLSLLAVAFTPAYLAVGPIVAFGST
jgi:hypothetical protein